MIRVHKIYHTMYIYEMIRVHKIYHTMYIYEMIRVHKIYHTMYTNLFAVKSNTLNRLFHPHGIIRRESKQHTALQKLLLYSKCNTKIFFNYSYSKTMGFNYASQAFVIQCIYMEAKLVKLKTELL